MIDNVNKSGHLSVGNGHKIYYEDWGNAAVKVPFVYLHGGPGGGFKDKNKLFFDPKKHRVIFHDQRGAGKSTPNGSLEDNATEHLVNDIDKLLKHLKLDKVILVGGSWGSALSLFYAIHNPKVVQAMVLMGIFLGSRSELDTITNGQARLYFPEAWDRFVANVPEDKRVDIARYYFDQVTGKSKPRAHKFAFEWLLYDAILIGPSTDLSIVEQNLRSDEETDQLTLARTELHYIANDCFMPDNYILANVGKIKHIPTQIVQGRYDFICPAQSAYDLAQAMDKAELTFTLATHRSSDPMNFELFRQAIRHVIG